jgi:hypothetical protein
MAKKKKKQRKRTASRLTRAEWAALLAKSRARALSPERRAEIARNAALARWQRAKP